MSEPLLPGNLCQGCSSDTARFHQSDPAGSSRAAGFGVSAAV